MPRKRNMLHVHDFIANVCEMCEYLERDEQLMQPAMREWVAQVRVVGRAILRKHDTRNKATGQRKDIYVEAKAQR